MNKIKLLFFIAITVLTTVLAIFYVNTQQVKTTSDLVEHTQEVLRKSDDFLLDVLDIETSARGFVLTGNETFLKPFDKAALTINDNLSILKKLTKNKPNQQLRIDSLIQSGIKRKNNIDKILDAKKNNQLSELEKMTFITEGLVITGKIKERIAVINAEEFELLKQRKLENDKSNRMTEWSFIGLLFSLLGIASLVALVLENQKKRIKNTLDEYKHFFNQSTDFACIANMEGYYEVVNDSFERVLGYSDDILLKNKFVDLVHPDDKEATLKEMKQLYDSHRTVNFVNRYLKENGEYVWFDWNSSFSPDTKKIYAIARDITEQKRVATELLDSKNKAEEAQDKAEVAMKSKQQFLSNMSHEIRTPLNGIIGFTKVILKTNLSAKQKEYLTAIKMSGDTLIVLINDILDLAKVDAGKMTFEQTPFKIASSIASMMHLFETKIQEKNLILVKEYDHKIPDVVVGDPIRLHQIILNLVSNAVKFTTKGRITISVKLLKEETDNVAVEFAIADTGIGIAADKIDTIFENFHQAASHTSRLYGGTGLGLSIAKQLVESQGGTIHVESTVDEGSIFSFTLNFLKTEAEAEVVMEILELDKDIKNIKVLVVEDMPLNQLLMKTILDDFGFERDIANNGLVAIEKLKTKSYDVILMDLQMPEMNGFEATEYIRNTLKSKIPIIALTADVTTVDVEKCKAVGMNDYIAKPVNEALLYSKIVGFVKKPMPPQTKKVNGVAQPEKRRYTNMDYLTKITKANPTLMMEIIDAYLAQTPTLIQEMKQSFHNQDWDIFHAAVHKMVPSFSIMGINSDFEKMAKMAIEHARIEQEMHNIPDYVMQLEMVCLQACEELREEFKVLNKTKIIV